MSELSKMNRHAEKVKDNEEWVKMIRRIQIRTSYERAVLKLAKYSLMARRAAAGLAPPLGEWDVGQMKALEQFRDELDEELGL